MLTYFPFLAFSLFVLIGQGVEAGTKRLTTHPEQSAPTTRAVRAGRSHPKRLDSTYNHDMNRPSRDVTAQTVAHPSLPLNNRASRGILYTVDIEIAGVSLPVLVGLNSV
jgi:hypothetical protein